jgi:hypothetical protein
MPHGDAVGDGDGAELARGAAAGGHALLHRLSLAHQRDVAGGRLVPAARHADEGLMDLLPGEPHRVIEGAVRRPLGTLGHVAAGQLRLEVGLRVHHFAPSSGPVMCPPARSSRGRVWPNRGAAGRDSHSDVNVLAVLRASNMINGRLTPNVTPWPQQRPALAKNVAGGAEFHCRRNRGSKPSSARALAIETTLSSSAML